VAIANYPGDFHWEDSFSYVKLSSKLCDLKDENPDSPIMAGEARIQSGIDSECDIALEPLMCQIHLNSLCCDFHTRPYKGEKLRNVRIYLTNVNGRCEVLRKDDFRPAVLVNDGKLDEETVSKLSFPGLVFKDLGEDIGEDVVKPDLDLYCYPNDSEEETLGSPHTRLVIEGELGGKKYYYPINVNEEGFGYSEGEKGLHRNTRYSLNITITRTGSADPDIAVEKGTATIGCNVKPWNEKENATVTFGFPTGALATKSSDPDEDKISDINLFVFNSLGELDGHEFFRDQALFNGKNGISCKTELIKNSTYSIYACANFGYPISGIRTLEDLMQYRFHLAYPDEYREGIPMSGKVGEIRIDDDGDVVLPMTRMMSKISLDVDRTGLEKGTKIYVRSVRIGGCPTSATPFSESKANDEDDVFETGFFKGYGQVDALNKDETLGHSGQISLYMLENRQGDLLEDIMSDKEKIFQDGDPRSKVCSFIEIKSEFISDSCYTKPGEFLIYRFYLGENRRNFDIERNCHYHFTLKPEGSGISEDSWRVDKSGIGIYVDKIELSRNAIEMNYVGQEIDISAKAYPQNASSGKLYWESSDPSVAETYPHHEADGEMTGTDCTVKATGGGECTIICKSADGKSAEARCKIAVCIAPTVFTLHPGNYISGTNNEKIHIWCDLFPPDVPFEISKKDLEFDKARGIYDYEMDEDGLGVVLTLKNNGTGLINIDAGPPINDGFLVIVVVNP